MNVIISNKQQSLLQGLNIDIIKSVVGEFSAEEIVSDFRNFYFQRMVLDVTAIKGYKDIKELQKLTISLDMDKVILLLDGSEESSSSEYLSKLISMGIYNFAKNADGIQYLYQNPNSYRDVAQYHQLDTPIPDAIPGAVTMAPIVETASGVRIIGIKNLNEAAGATTLTYLIVRQLQRNYNAIGVEVDKNDLMFFKHKGLFTVGNNEISGFIAKNYDKDVIIVDMNNSTLAPELVQHTIYLMEPSVIKLNKMMLVNPTILKGLGGKKVILNQSLLCSKEVLEFEYEAKAKFFFNMPPLNERDKSIPVLDAFLVKLGFLKQRSDEEEERKKILGIF